MARGDAFQLQGLDGGVMLSAGESAPAGNYRWMQVKQDAVLSVFTSNIVGADTKLVGITLFAGDETGGVITAVTVTSGRVILYKMA